MCIPWILYLADDFIIQGAEFIDASVHQGNPCDSGFRLLLPSARFQLTRAAPVDNVAGERRHVVARHWRYLWEK